jgi:hypothetical protein
MHQTNLVTFDLIEEWNQQMFAALLRPPPAGHKYVTTQQILSADKQLWMHISQQTRGKLISGIGEKPPLDEQLKNYMRSPEVLCFMTPLPSVRAEAPSGHRSEPYSRAEQSSGSGKGKGKNKFQSKGAASGPSSGPTIKEMLTNMPDGCSSKLPNGQWLFSTTEGFANIRRKHVVIWGFTNVTTRVAQRSDLTLSVSTDLVSRNKTIQFLTLMQTSQ